MKLFDKALKSRSNILKKVIRNQSKREETFVKNGEGPGGETPSREEKINRVSECGIFEKIEVKRLDR